MGRLTRGIRRQLNFFFIGFIVAFIIYLLVRYDFDDIVLGAVIGAIGGVAVVAVAIFLDRRFPDDRNPTTTADPNG